MPYHQLYLLAVHLLGARLPEVDFLQGIVGAGLCLAAEIDVTVCALSDVVLFVEKVAAQKDGAGWRFLLVGSHCYDIDLNIIRKANAILVR